MLKRLLGDTEAPQVFVCGPPVMMSKVIAALRSLTFPARDIHYERFALR